MVSRRQFLRAGAVTLSTGVVTLLAGCNTDSTKTTTPTSTSGPDPRVESTRVPNPVVASTSDNKSEQSYTAEVQNTGEGGRVGVDFHWANGDMEDGEPTTLTPEETVPQQTITMDAGETRTVTVNPGEKPDPSYGYWFSAVPLSATISVHNAGDSGDVTVKLVGKNGVISSETIAIQADSTDDVSLPLTGVSVDSRTALRIEFDV